MANNYDTPTLSDLLFPLWFPAFRCGVNEEIRRLANDTSFCPTCSHVKCVTPHHCDQQWGGTSERPARPSSVLWHIRFMKNNPLDYNSWITARAIHNM